MTNWGALAKQTEYIKQIFGRDWLQSYLDTAQDRIKEYIEMYGLTGEEQASLFISMLEQEVLCFDIRLIGIDINNDGALVHVAFRPLSKKRIMELLC